MSLVVCLLIHITNALLFLLALTGLTPSQAEVNSSISNGVKHDNPPSPSKPNRRTHRDTYLPGKMTGHSIKDRAIHPRETYAPYARCICPGISSWLCGSNGVSYQNYCWMVCAGARFSGRGKCDKKAIKGYAYF